VLVLLIYSVLAQARLSSASSMPSANARWYKVGDALLVLSQGDITQWSGDALVNAGELSQLKKVTPLLSKLQHGLMGALCCSTVITQQQLQSCFQ
jgi:hypothetical protein